MTDAWADVRKLIGDAPKSDMGPRKMTRSLLTDADALLAVAHDGLQFHRYLYTIRSKGDPNPSFEKWLEMVNPRLAAIPEHLK